MFLKFLLDLLVIDSFELNVTFECLKNLVHLDYLEIENVEFDNNSFENLKEFIKYSTHLTNLKLIRLIKHFHFNINSYPIRMLFW